MAGVKLYPGKMMTKTAMMTTELARLRPYVEEAKNVLNEPEDHIALLKGNGWDSVRQYIETVQRPLLSSYSLWLNAQLEATEKYRCAASALPGVQCLDQDKLRSELANYQRKLAREQRKEHPSRSAISHYRSMIREIESKLQDIERFLQRTAGIYDDAQQAQNKLKHANTTLPKFRYTLLMKSLSYADAGESWLPILMAFLDARIEAVKEAEFTECLELLLGEKGSMYLSQILSKGEISDIEAQAIAYALIMSGDEKLLETALNGCYKLVGPKTTSVGGMETICIVYEKSPDFDKIYQSMNAVTQGLFSAAAAADPEKVKKLNPRLLTAMQYMQMFETVKGVDYQLTVCSYHNIMDTISQITWVKGTGSLISVEKNDDGKLIAKWCQYANYFGEALPYEQQKEITVIVSTPALADAAQWETTQEALEYIRSSFSIGDYRAIPAAVGKGAIDMFIGEVPGSNIFGFLQSVTSEVSNIQSDKKTFETATTIAQLGPVLNLFNLYYVSAVTEEEGVAGQVHQFTIYPSFQCDDKERALLSTQECIDNFNANFGVDGAFSESIDNVEIDLPLTLEHFGEELQDIAEAVKSWYTYSERKSITAREATEPQQKGKK